LVAALFWKRATRTGAIASIISGTVTAIAWAEMDFIKNAMPGCISGLDAVLPAITVSVAALILVSLLTKKAKT
jgi:Na+/proline symporter